MAPPFSLDPHAHSISLDADIPQARGNPALLGLDELPPEAGLDGEPREPEGERFEQLAAGEHRPGGAPETR